MGRGAGKSKGTTAPSGAGLSLAAATMDDQLASSLDVNAEQELAMLLAVPSREGTSVRSSLITVLPHPRPTAHQPTAQ
jgi:protein-arginine kinase